MLISVLEKVFYFFGSDKRHLLLQDQVSVNRQTDSSTLKKDLEAVHKTFPVYSCNQCIFGNSVNIFL